MKRYFKILTGFFLLYTASGCHSTKKLQTAISKKDTTVVTIVPLKKDSTLNTVDARDALIALNKNKIDFKTFSSKAKVEYQDRNGKQPDFNAFIRLQKDSVLWISISSTFLGIEAFRLYVTPDTLMIINKLDKSVEFHPFGYIESFAHIPMTFRLLQNIIIGNPVYVGDSIVSYRETESHVLIGTVGDYFKNLITLSAGTNHLERIKLDDVHLNQNRTAALVYGNYQKSGRFDFATNREINVSEKSKVDISIEFKQYEFNKELSFPHEIPRNYKTK